MDDRVLAVVVCLLDDVMIVVPDGEAPPEPDTYRFVGTRASSR
jgi:hypothetical protein